jgi:aldose 1-epimerase
MADAAENAMTDLITIANPDGSLQATFMPALGMVGCSLRHEGDELLAQQGGASAYAASGSTFGIPLLHPWANRLSAWDYSVAGGRVELERKSTVLHVDGATGLPIHGVLAASPDWRVTDVGSDRVEARLEFSRPEYLVAFPFEHTLTYTATIAGDSLRIALRVQASGGVAVPVSFGFHPYLTLPGSDRRRWSIELPVAQRAVLDSHMIPTGESEAVQAGQLDGRLGDRVFDTNFPALRSGSTSPATFAVSDERRRLEVEFTDGYPVAQVFAPDSSDFICFEPMTAPVDALRSGVGLRWTKPHGEFTAVFVISVR